METIFARDWGICPNTGEDATAHFAEMLRAYPRDAEFLLEPGRYDFFASQARLCEYYLSNSDIVNPRRLSILLSQMENIAFIGNGAELVFHGQTMPFTVDGSRDVTIRNLTIDWDIPLTAEGRVVAATAKHLDMCIDPRLFPYEVREDRLVFLGEDWAEPVWDWGNTEFDAHTGKVASGRGDTFPKTTQRQLPDGLVRFLGDFQAPPLPGNIVVLRHGQRVHAGIFIQNSTNVTVQEVTIYATGGLGILTQFSENLSFLRIQMCPNRGKGREFVSGHDDGIHLSSNSGVIRVEECSFLGLMDDPLNLHGIAAKIEVCPDRRTVLGRFMHSQSKGFNHWAEVGQTVAFLNGSDMRQLAEGTVKSFTLCGAETFWLELEEPLPEEVGPGDSMENLSRTAALICRNNHFGSCRARGILFCTPKPVLVENNVFESAGAAILIAGDASTWYESGGCRDVVIRENYFADCCLSSQYLGGEAVISIHPELSDPCEEHPCHRNITIEDNLFLTSDTRILYALCTSGVIFRNNRIMQSHAYPMRRWGREPVTTQHCTDVTMEHNLFIGEVFS